VSPLNRHLFCFRITAKSALGGAIAVAWICLSGCVSSGFYQMSDDWCMQHPAANPARCYRNPTDVVLVGRTDGSHHQSDGSQQPAEQEPSAPLPAFVLSRNSTGESADELSTAGR